MICLAANKLQTLNQSFAPCLRVSRHRGREQVSTDAVYKTKNRTMEGTKIREPWREPWKAPCQIGPGRSMGGGGGVEENNGGVRHGSGTLPEVSKAVC